MPAKDFDKSRQFDVITPIHVAFFSFPTPLMKAVEKAKVIRIVRAELEAQYRRVAAAAREAHGYATDPDSKAESKYDTRGLEASYLAAGQAAKADELAEAMKTVAQRNQTSLLDLNQVPRLGRTAIGGTGKWLARQFVG